MASQSLDVTQLVRRDAKGRIYLGNITHGISSYKIDFDETSREIHLTPYIKIPLSQQSLFNEAQALQCATAGLQQSIDQTDHHA